MQQDLTRVGQIDLAKIIKGGFFGVGKSEKSPREKKSIFYAGDGFLHFSTLADYHLS